LFHITFSHRDHVSLLRSGESAPIDKVAAVDEIMHEDEDLMLANARLALVFMGKTVPRPNLLLL